MCILFVCFVQNIPIERTKTLTDDLNARINIRITLTVARRYMLHCDTAFCSVIFSKLEVFLEMH